MTNSVSFLHLNIQSIVPKLDFIVAEYSCHDISITELSESKVVSTDFLPATLSLISQGSFALKLNNEQNVINGKARMP
jgi:hypothetical protein